MNIDAIRQAAGLAPMRAAVAQHNVARRIDALVFAAMSGGDVSLADIERALCVAETKCKEVSR